MFFDKQFILHQSNTFGRRFPSYDDDKDEDDDDEEEDHYQQLFKLIYNSRDH